MATTFDIIVPRGVVVIRHSGHLTAAEGQAAFQEFLGHPDARPGQHHLVDCSGVVSYERDFAAILALQAKIADHFTPEMPQMLLVLYAPPGPPHEVATIIRNSWAGTPTVIPRAVSNEAEALTILGLTEPSIADLLALV